MAHNPLYPFLLKAALWLPVCLGLWYWKAEWFNAPAVMVSGWVLQSLFGGWVESVEWAQRIFSVATALRLGAAPGMPEGEYTLVLEVNPLVYGFGLPLFAALLLAGSETNRWRKLALGALLLIPFQAWGICFDLLKQAAVTSGADVSAQTRLMPWQVEGIALGYQFGALILPTVVPIVIWLWLDRGFIVAVIVDGQLRKVH